MKSEFVVIQPNSCVLIKTNPRLETYCYPIVEYNWKMQPFIRALDGSCWFLFKNRMLLLWMCFMLCYFFLSSWLLTAALFPTAVLQFSLVSYRIFLCHIYALPPIHPPIPRDVRRRCRCGSNKPVNIFFVIFLSHSSSKCNGFFFFILKVWVMVFCYFFLLPKLLIYIWNMNIYTHM